LVIKKLHYFSRYRTTIEQLNNEITALDKRIQTIKKQTELPTTEEDIKLQMQEFLKVHTHINRLYGIFNTFYFFNFK
jgi:inverted formin-2